MYQCNHCGELIEQPEERRETEMHEAHGARQPYETILRVCPFCGSDDIEDCTEEMLGVLADATEGALAEEDDDEDAEQGSVEAR